MPPRRSDLCLNLVLRMPVSNATIRAEMEYMVFNCPVIPTEVPKVPPMSINRREAKTEIGPEAKLDMTRDDRKSLLCVNCT